MNNQKKQEDTTLNLSKIILVEKGSDVHQKMEMILIIKEKLEHKQDKLNSGK